VGLFFQPAVAVGGATANLHSGPNAALNKLFNYINGLNVNFGAGEGNRTLALSLEGFCSTNEPHPLRARLVRNIDRIVARRREGKPFFTRNVTVAG
jgi:hypothetical protein